VPDNLADLILGVPNLVHSDTEVTAGTAPETTLRS
jgi:hypothetical protein